MIFTLRQINDYGSYLQSIKKPKEALYPHALVLDMLNKDLTELEFNEQTLTGRVFCQGIKAFRQLKLATYKIVKEQEHENETKR